MGKRSHYWEHENGVEATVACLVLIFQSCLGLIVEQNCNIYSTTSWKTEIDQDKLVYNKILLQKLLELDPRGGFLAQVVVKDALHEALGKSGDLASIMSHQLPGMESGEEGTRKGGRAHARASRSGAHTVNKSSGVVSARKVQVQNRAKHPRA